MKKKKNRKKFYTVAEMFKMEKLKVVRKEEKKKARKESEKW